MFNAVRKILINIQDRSVRVRVRVTVLTVTQYLHDLNIQRAI